MIRQGVILYGPPASGKDTTTKELSLLDRRFELFRRLKAGPGRTVGYRATTSQRLTDMAAKGEILYLNARYGATYAIDRAGLDAMVVADKIPVMHLGQVAGILALKEYPVFWTTVLLWCSRETTRERCEKRGSSDVGTRLDVWGETLKDIVAADGSTWSLIIDTADHSVAESAALIAKEVANPGNVVLLNADLMSR